jgi:hypothetical protein
MRTLILLSTLVLLAACSDDQHATAPRTSRSASNSTHELTTRIQDLTPGANAQGKPASAFSTITTVISADKSIPAFSSSTDAHADCPAGTTVVGGGFQYGFFASNAPPTTTSSLPHNNGWWVTIGNEVSGAGDAVIRVWALCLS